MIAVNEAKESARMGKPVLRIKPKQTRRIVVISTNVIYIDTHWLSGRQVWCAGDDCLGCQLTRPRTKAYFLAEHDLGKERQVVLVETTPGAVQVTQQAIQMQEDTWRPGIVLLMQRLGKRQPTIMVVDGCEEPPMQQINSDRTTIAAAAVLASMPMPTADETLDHYNQRAQKIAQKKIEAMVN